MDKARSKNQDSLCLSAVPIESAVLLEGTFSLCQKLGVGTVHLPQCEQSSASEREDLCITSYQQPEDVSIAEKYRKVEVIFELSPLDHD